MKKDKQIPDVAKYVFWGAVFLSFLSVYFYNMFTPYMSDDLLFDKSLYHSFADVIKQEYWQYHNWTGRSVLQIILKIAMLMPKPLFDIINSLCYVGTMLLVYLNIRERKQYDVLLYVLINLCMWVFGVEFSQTILWVAGACNYLWGVFIILGLVFIIGIIMSILSFGIGYIIGIDKLCYVNIAMSISVISNVLIKMISDYLEIPPPALRG